MKENPVPALGQPPARTGCYGRPCHMRRRSMPCRDAYSSGATEGCAQQRTGSPPRFSPERVSVPGQQPLVALEQLARRPRAGRTAGPPRQCSASNDTLAGTAGTLAGPDRCLRERPEQRVHGGPRPPDVPSQRDHGQAKRPKTTQSAASTALALLLRNVGHVERNDHRQAERGRPRTRYASFPFPRSPR